MPPTGGSGTLAQTRYHQSPREAVMANEDSTFLLVGAYANVDDARADYEVV